MRKVPLTSYYSIFAPLEAIMYSVVWDSLGSESTRCDSPMDG